MIPFARTDDFQLRNPHYGRGPLGPFGRGGGMARHRCVQELKAFDVNCPCGATFTAMLSRVGGMTPPHPGEFMMPVPGAVAIVCTRCLRQHAQPATFLI